MPLPLTPALTVDIIIELVDRENCPIVLIERHFAPLGWALPGGFVDVGECLEQAAIREAYEETGLKVNLRVLLGCYSDPARDQRGHSVSAVYIATGRGVPVAQDDAKSIAVIDPQAPSEAYPLVFDHALILTDYVHYRINGQLPPLRVP
ncbi:MAG: NUDIX hydrolase [Gammaproteobacteria bacterium]